MHTWFFSVMTLKEVARSLVCISSGDSHAQDISSLSGCPQYEQLQRPGTKKNFVWKKLSGFGNIRYHLISPAWRHDLDSPARQFRWCFESRKKLMQVCEDSLWLFILCVADGISRSCTSGAVAARELAWAGKFPTWLFAILVVASPL